MNLTIFLFVIFPVLAIGLVCLQIFLSRCESRWLGLILPFISFGFSLIVVLGIGTYGMELGDLIVMILLTLLIANIPTFLLMAIYAGCREMLRRKKSIERMSIQDLE